MKRFKAIPATGLVSISEADEVLSHNLSCYRCRLGLTQQALSDRLGIKLSRLGSYEEGRAQPPLAMLLDFAQAFKVTLDELLLPH
jgi:DNA-binding XRE family transcriptional regulator